MQFSLIVPNLNLKAKCVVLPNMWFCLLIKSCAKQEPKRFYLYSVYQYTAKYFFIFRQRNNGIFIFN